MQNIDHVNKEMLSVSTKSGPGINNTISNINIKHTPAIQNNDHVNPEILSGLSKSINNNVNYTSNTYIVSIHHLF